jgi:hypothetical protein
MSNRRFEVYQYRQIIFRLRSGESMRSIARTKLADRKTIRKVHNISKQHGWLDTKHEIPNDEVLAKYLGQPKLLSQNNLLLPHKIKVEEWSKQKIQAREHYARSWKIIN